MLRTRVSFKNIEERLGDQLKNEVTELASRQFEPLVKRLWKDRARLAIQIEGNARKKLYSVALRMHLPKKVLVCREEGKDLNMCLQAAVNELREQLEKYVARVKKEDAWKRKARRAELRRLKAASESGEAQEREIYYDLIKKHIPQLQRIVKHELTYMRARGDLPPDYPRIEDVVDETLARAFKLVKERSPEISVEAWLVQIAIEVIAEEVAQFRSQEGMDVLEKGFSPLEFVPEDEIFEFYQPDEMLTIEDLAAASPYVSIPEEPTEERERRLYLYRLLALLPTKWRQALNLVFMEEMPRAQVAKVLGTKEQNIDEWLANAEAFLREKMLEAGYTPPETGSYFDYLLIRQEPEKYKIEVEEELKETLGV
ncbi:MAG: hypothetical protein DRH12_11810 [Deltaproteobacteria bacterium]|nr:MAG: hypothetical protein DRH12_11810 [Deltaproteobacteria bacterium]